MPSMRDIKQRRNSIQSTEQITNAMKLSSTVKLQRARGKADNSRPYFNIMYDTICSMINSSGNLVHRYLKAPDSDKKAVIAITSNRGLAGGYNNNIIKLIQSHLPAEDTYIYALGRKGKEGLERRGYSIAADYSEVLNEPLYSDASDITKVILDAFLNDEIGEIYLAYTTFKNPAVQIPKFMQLLPINIEPEEEDTSGHSKALMTYEPEEDEVLDAIIPKYISSLIYGALLDAAASEHGARMTAMDSATKNAEDMINELGLEYNKARQAAITQELTEIVAGANAIS